MRTYFWIFLLLLSTACSHRSLKVLQSELDSIANRYAPDKRTAIAEVKLLGSGYRKVVVSGETMFPEFRAAVFDRLSATPFRISDSLRLLPAPNSNHETWGLVGVSVANLRSRPSHPAELVTQAVMGTPVKVWKKNGGWLLVQTPDHYLGWTNVGSVVLNTESERLTWRQSERLIYTHLTGSITDGYGEIVSDLVAGSLVQLLETSDSHYHIRLPDGRLGRVEKTGFRLFDAWAQSVTLSSDSLRLSALQYLGLPYLWGGTSSKAFDCSGFTKTLFFLQGVVLERDASQQIRHGERVEIDPQFANLLPGDLLFFGTREPFRVVHVGVWVGNGEVVHASGSVKRESMHPDRPNFSNYLFDTFLDEVRRISPDLNSLGMLPVKNHTWYF